MSRGRQGKSGAGPRAVAARVVVSGRVQGVCFRMEAVRAARLRGVTGWVRNCPDGRVEAEFQGSQDDVEAMIAWCRRGPPAAHVSTVDVSWREVTSLSSGFVIRY